MLEKLWTGLKCDKVSIFANDRLTSILLPGRWGRCVGSIVVSLSRHGISNVCAQGAAKQTDNSERFCALFFFHDPIGFRQYRILLTPCRHLFGGRKDTPWERTKNHICWTTISCSMGSLSTPVDVIGRFRRVLILRFFSQFSPSTGPAFPLSFGVLLQCLICHVCRR